MNRTSTEQETANQGVNWLQSLSSIANEIGRLASWRSGDAADCKSVYTGSIPVLASI